MQLRVHEQK